MNKKGKTTLLIMLFAGLAACSSAPEIEITQAWLRLPPGGRDMTGGYVLLQNTGGKDALLRVASPIAQRIEIHQTFEQDGMMQMRQLNVLPIAAHETTALQPGGTHLMIFGISDVQLGQQVELVLEFEKSGTRKIIAQIGKPSPAP